VPTAQVTLSINGKSTTLDLDTRTTLLDALREHLHLHLTGTKKGCDCTPGQICSAVGVLDEVKRGVPSHATADLNVHPLLSVDELRERMSGNICRCGAYSNIVDAITEVNGASA